MTNEEAKEMLLDMEGNIIVRVYSQYVEAIDLAIKALEQCEIWNGSHGQIVAPKGTFERIYNDCKDEQQPNYLKKRDGNYVHYNVEWLLKNWQMELDILSDGKIKPCEDCISRADVLALAEKGILVSNGNYKSICKAINELPSVQSTRPKGKWLATENEEMNIVGYYCSSCDLPMETEEKTAFCPNCGVRMAESEG